MNWKRLVACAVSGVVMYYMAKFTLAHLKEGGMVWWGGWIAVFLFATAAFVMMQQFKAAQFRLHVLNRIASFTRYAVLLITVVFIWEALVRGVPLSSDVSFAPSHWLGRFL